MKRNTPSILFYFQVGMAVFLLPFCKGFSQSHQLPARFDSLLAIADQLIYQNYPRSNSLYDTLEKIIVKAGTQYHPLPWINLIHQRAVAAFYNGKLIQCKKHIDEAFTSIQKYKDQIGSRSDSLKSVIRFIQALYFREIGRYDEALEILIEVERYAKSQPVNAGHCRTLFQITQYEASIYGFKGEYESAINQYLASIQFYNCYRDKNTYPNYVLIYRNIGEAYQEKGDYENAHYYFLKARANLDSCLTLIKESKVRTHALVLFQSIANYFILNNNLDSARFYFHLAIPFLKENPAFAIRIYNGQARIAMKERQFDKALALYSKSLNIYRNEYGEKHGMTSRIYNLIALLYEQQGDLDKALLFEQRALNSLAGLEELDIHDGNVNPTLEHVFSKKLMLETLHQKAILLNGFYNINNSEKFLQKARETNLLAIQLLDSTRNEFSLEKDKVVLGEEAFRIYETSIQIANQLFQTSKDPKYVSECFELMDKSKSAVLLDHLKIVRNFSGVPPALLEREMQLKAELTSAEEALFESEVQRKESSKPRQTLGELKKAYAELFTEIKRSYPQYYQLRIEHKIVTLPEVQHQLLRGDQALVEYFVGDSSLYIVCVTPNRSWIAVASSDSLREQVIELRNAIINNNGYSGERYQSWVKNKSAVLYKRLISPWINSMDPATSSLIIIPQGILTYLPYEMLSSEEHDGFLIDQFSISYASSASLLSEQKQMKVSGNSFAGFSADYSNNKVLPQLAGSLPEVRSIHDLFDADSRIFDKATADDFRKEAYQYKILHLALHSYINDEKPMFSRLVFTQGLSETSSDITANELYGMQLGAELAVLSACETGIGQLHRGEGMMSLSRAFMYAGVPSTIISLWKVPDQTTSLVMTKFYKFLKSGLPKDEAMAKAKKEFIKDYPEMSSPFFWAGFVVNGKTDPIAFSPVWMRWKLAVTAILLCSVVFLLLWAGKKFPFRINRSSIL